MGLNGAERGDIATRLSNAATRLGAVAADPGFRVGKYLATKNRAFHVDQANVNRQGSFSVRVGQRRRDRITLSVVRDDERTTVRLGYAGWLPGLRRKATVEINGDKVGRLRFRPVSTHRQAERLRAALAAVERPMPADVAAVLKVSETLDRELRDVTDSNSRAYTLNGVFVNQGLFGSFTLGESIAEKATSLVEEGGLSADNEALILTEALAEVLPSVLSTKEPKLFPVDGQNLKDLKTLILATNGLRHNTSAITGQIGQTKIRLDRQFVWREDDVYSGKLTHALGVEIPLEPSEAQSLMGTLYPILVVANWNRHIVSKVLDNLRPRSFRL